MSGDKAFEVWREGFRVTGQSATAELVDTVKASDFRSACSKVAQKHSWGPLYNESRLTYWGCRLFENEADARKSFG